MIPKSRYTDSNTSKSKKAMHRHQRNEERTQPGSRDFGEISYSSSSRLGETHAFIAHTGPEAGMLYVVK